ncbi:hypothetical protein UFOVP581_26 [uncultured Caudovirales phage]|uniref:Uncharacterized protein n=1 Tax=uncultured Caudovirales phage TaxID=2100421 RepID=A0A6J5PII0_9CAUD|nr:hypothetical protein UFOVP581_26 [uncultured Caudovirales phage]
MSNQELRAKDPLSHIESAMLDMPQVDASTSHYFGPSIYIREVTLPTGAFVVGHHHKTAHMNIMIKGVIDMLYEDGTTEILRAPLVLESGPGRKACYVIEECVWQNIHATEERNIDKLEEMLLTKSEAWTNHQQRYLLAKLKADSLNLIEVA